MFLKPQRQQKRRQLFMALRADDRGAALAAVLGLMATLLMLSVVLVTSVYQTTAFTSYSRASVQSQASAEAGIAAARAWLIGGNCTPGSTDPAKTTISNANFAGVGTIFSAKIQVKEAGTWITKCPASLAAPVRIEATGTASATGAGGMSGADSTTLEAILSAQPGAGQWEGTGAAVFAYRSDGFTAGGKMFSVDSTEPDILVKKGDLNCTGNAQGVKHLVVEGGNLQIGNSCNVEGNVWASGSVSVSGNIRIGLATCPAGKACGNVVAGGNFVVASGSPWVYGNVWSHATADLSGNGIVYGQLKARGLNWKGSHLNSTTHTSYIYGPAEFRNNSVTLNNQLVVQQVAYPAGGWASIGSATIRSRTTVQNPITSPSFTSDLPANPIVPDWFDYDFDPADWEGFVTIAISPNSSAPGYGAPTWYGFETGTCKAPEINAAVAAAGTSKLVIDARNCPKGVKISNNDTATINADVAIIADKFVLGNSGKLLSASGTPHRIWLVTPDTNTTLADGKPAPHCNTTTQGFTMDGSFTFGTTGATANRVMIYTPCRVNMTSGNSMWGQVFSGEAAINGNFNLYYDPIGFPGYDLNTGQPVGGGGSELDRIVESIRNIG